MHAWKRYAHDVKIYRSVNSSYILNIVSPSILSFAIYRDFSYVFCNSLGKEKDRGEKKKNPGRERNFISTRYSNENASDINTNQFSRRLVDIVGYREFQSTFYDRFYPCFSQSGFATCRNDVIQTDFCLPSDRKLGGNLGRDSSRRLVEIEAQGWGTNYPPREDKRRPFYLLLRERNDNNCVGILTELNTFPSKKFVVSPWDSWISAILSYKIQRKWDDLCPSCFILRLFLLTLCTPGLSNQ